MGTHFRTVLLLTVLSASVWAADTDAPGTLRRQTAELLQAISDGSAAVWERYLHADARITDENGSVLGKAQFLQQVRPLPTGVSGVLELRDFDTRVTGDTAVATYLIDEHEMYHGHALHCQYRNTDTWIRTRSGWRLLATQSLALRIDPPAVSLSNDLLSQYVGRYALTPEISYEIRIKDDALEGQRTGRQAERLLAEAADVLFVPGKPRYRMIVERDGGGRVAGFAERREAWDLVWKRVAQPARPR